MLIFAYPGFRVRHHDTFEIIHRFAGWTAVALVWAQVRRAVERSNYEGWLKCLFFRTSS